MMPGIMTEVAAGVHALGSERFNWYVIERGGRFTLVDSGLPTHWPQLASLLETRGAGLENVEAVLLTHGHGDHAGNAERARTDTAATVYAHPDEWGPARSGTTHGRVGKDILKDIWRPSFLSFLAELYRGGAFSFPPMTKLSAIQDGDTVDVPGNPRVIAVPGHTAGSCALYLADDGVAFTGDALLTYCCTGSVRTGPQIATDLWHEDPEQALTSLDRLEGLGAHTVLPGHGDPWSDGIDEAVRLARRLGRR
jgi:glyoxylase-like metal-dependent hydrolase (beta-lactamase superfamily II)